MKKILFIALFILNFAGFAEAQNNKFQPQSNTNVGPGDCSGTITTGGTAQNMLAAATNRSGFQVFNLDTTEVMWISFTGTATPNTQGSFPLPPASATTFAGGGSYYSNVGFNKAISVVAATTGHKFSCTNW